MQTLAVGNKKHQGFTLLELLIVLGIMAALATGVSLAIPSPSERALAQDGERLAALLEAGRARSRASGIPVMFRTHAGEHDFIFEHIHPDISPIPAPATITLPSQWLHSSTHATAAQLLLGPEPVIAPQSIQLFGDTGQRLIVATDGVRPFAVRHTAEVSP